MADAVVFTSSEQAFMAEAIRLAESAVPNTHPNPAVGCVIVKANTIVGRGQTQPPGGHHAEIAALENCPDGADGATVFVTLEPCCTYGRTGPCTDALIRARVARVVVAVTDPNPDVNGAGIAALRSAGITVDLGLMADVASRSIEGFQSRMLRGRPFVTLKLGMSLDGATAMASGESQWITGDAARRDVQRLRARHAAVMTGIGTILVDDPSLNVRDASGQAVSRQPWRVVIDSNHRTPIQSRCVSLPGHCLVVGCGPAEGAAALREAGAQYEQVGRRGGHVDLAEALAVLGRLEVNSVLAECGPSLAGALVANRLVDRFVFYIAPVLLGSVTRSAIQTPDWLTLSQGQRLEIQDLRQVGQDIRMTAAVLSDGET
ncbi:MAG: bifunctional diaminohydroxyphosphoribosylaminopyrimidine deaminase/5-amino-6-(5-phosphoribosylamino)uracil reductase RibD [Woeseiaceae bacterium]